MSDIKLFRLNQNSVTELESKSVAVEKSLQSLIEKHMEDLLGIRILVREYRTALISAAVTGKIDVREEICNEA